MTMVWEMHVLMHIRPLMMAPVSMLERAMWFLFTPLMILFLMAPSEKSFTSKKIIVAVITIEAMEE